MSPDAVHAPGHLPARPRWPVGLFLIAGAILVPGQAACADNVTIYGAVDAGILSSRSGAPGSSHTIALSSGILTANRIGFRVNEDLGGGMRALAQLEAGFELDTGAAKAYSGNPSAATAAAPGGPSIPVGFNRRATVGMQTPYGSLVAGRDYTPVYFTGLATDAMTYGPLGNIQSILLLSRTGSERFARASNALFYTSPRAGGLLFRAMYSLGSEGAGLPGPTKDANRMAAVGTEFTTGAFLVSAAYQVLRTPDVSGTVPAFTGTTSSRKDYMLGARYALGAVTLFGGRFVVDHPGPANNGHDTWFGVSWKSGPSTVLAQAQRMELDSPTGADARGTIYGLAYLHALSPRTALYTSYGEVNNNANASFALAGSDMTVAAGARGASPKALALGVRHNF